MLSWMPWVWHAPPQFVASHPYLSLKSWNFLHQKGCVGEDLPLQLEQDLQGTRRQAESTLFVISSSLTHDWQLCALSFFLPFSAQGHGGIWTPCLYFGIHVTLCTIIRDEICCLFCNFSVLFMKLQHAPYSDERMLGVGTDAYRFKKHYDIQSAADQLRGVSRFSSPGHIPELAKRLQEGISVHQIEALKESLEIFLRSFWQWPFLQLNAAYYHRWLNVSDNWYWEGN